MNMRFRLALLACALTITHSSVWAAGLTIRAVLVDDHLNQKPVPRMRVLIKDVATESVVEAKTSLEGTASLDLPAGRYVLEAPDGVAFSGQVFRWTQAFEITDTPLVLELSNDNATSSAAPPRRVVDDLAQMYKNAESAVVTVWGDLGRGTGFLIDSSGLILTNDHVVGKPNYLAVQFDAKRKVAAHVLAADPANDISVIWANLANLADVRPVAIARSSESMPSLVEGERVFTIGSPLEQRKIVTSGVASKIEKAAILSDININPGNSGGPLFNSLGEVVGITTFIEQARAGQGVSGIVRIELAESLIAEARSKMAQIQPPSPDFLPVEPTDAYPLEALKAAISVPKFDQRPYRISAGPYDVVIVTPVLSYWHRYSGSVEVAKRREKRRGPDPSVENAFQPLDDLRSWAFYAGEYRPVIQVFARPKLRETFWSAVGRGFVAGAAGYSGTYAQLPPANLRYATDFYQMRLFCGPQEVPPIHPAREPEVADFQNSQAMARDATFVGAYTFDADAIAPSCGTVRLQLYSEKNPAQPQTVVLSAKTVSRVWSDFVPYRQTRDSSPPRQ